MADNIPETNQTQVIDVVGTQLGEGQVPSDIKADRVRRWTKAMSGVVDYEVVPGSLSNSLVGQITERDQAMVGLGGLLPDTFTNPDKRATVVEIMSTDIALAYNLAARSPLIKYSPAVPIPFQLPIVDHPGEFLDASVSYTKYGDGAVGLSVRVGREAHMGVVTTDGKLRANAGVPQHVVEASLPVLAQATTATLGRALEVYSRLP